MSKPEIEHTENDFECTLCVKNVPRRTYEAWQRAAKRHDGLSLSAWVRMTLSAAARGEGRTVARLERTR